MAEQNKGVTEATGRGGLPLLKITTPWSTAEIYRHGAHVAAFQKKGEPPLLFLSNSSKFEPRQPIRGGVPVIFPWFGSRDGQPMHGFARLETWEVKDVVVLPSGSTSVRFALPESSNAPGLPPFALEYVVTINQELTLGLIVTNKSKTDPLTFEGCLHTYFTVGDINDVSITGLKGATYLDKVNNLARKVETAEAISITSEFDRIYLDTAATVEIRDDRLRRNIRIRKENSHSTVVWNPWNGKAQQMPDFGNEEYRSMVCVESGNVAANQITLPPGKSTAMRVQISSVPHGFNPAAL